MSTALANCMPTFMLSQFFTCSPLLSSSHVSLVICFPFSFPPPPFLSFMLIFPPSFLFLSSTQFCHDSVNLVIPSHFTHFTNIPLFIHSLSCRSLNTFTFYSHGPYFDHIPPSPPCPSVNSFHFPPLFLPFPIFLSPTLPLFNIFRLFSFSLPL